MRHGPILVVRSLILVVASILAAGQQKDERLHSYQLPNSQGVCRLDQVDFYG